MYKTEKNVQNEETVFSQEEVRARMNGEKGKGLGETASELIAGMMLWGLLSQGVGMWFFADKGYYTAGLWIGVAISLVLTLHINHCIRRAVELSKEQAARYYQKMYTIRTGIFLVLFIGAMALRLGNAVALLLGLLSIKIGAYLQPILHRLRVKLRKKGR